MKTCFNSGKTKELELFTKVKKNKDGRSGKCKACAAKAMREVRQANPAKPKERDIFILKQLLKGNYPVQITSESLGKFSGRRIATIMRFYAKDEHYRALINAAEKFCPLCNQVLSKSKFHINLTNFDSLAVYCKECRNYNVTPNAKVRYHTKGNGKLFSVFDK